MPGPKVTGEDVLEAMRKRDREKYPVVTSTDLDDELDVTRRTISTRLRELEVEGRVKSRKVGSVPVWWLPEERMQAEEEHQPSSAPAPTRTIQHQEQSNEPETRTDGLGEKLEKELGQIRHQITERDRELAASRRREQQLRERHVWAFAGIATLLVGLFALVIHLVVWPWLPSDIGGTLIVMSLFFFFQFSRQRIRDTIHSVRRALSFFSHDESSSE